MVRTQKGFTLIELVMVIVILGILAAVAIPRYLDLSSDANNAALKGVAGTMASGMATNYASRSLSNVAAYGYQVGNCTDVASVLTGGLPSGYTVDSALLSSPGATATCTVHQVSSGLTATFVGIGSR